MPRLRSLLSSPRRLAALLALLLAACAQTPDSLPALEGTRWIGPGSARPQLRLDAEGRASGFGGCNRFSGRWSAEGSHLRLGPMAATRMMCLTPGGEQETVFLAALEQTRSARLEGRQLLLLDAQGQVLLVLQPADAP